jgi:nucleoside-triphosphatase
MKGREINLFVTGQPGVGKTTLIERVLGALDVRAGGFYTREIRRCGSRVGFAIVGLDGTEGVLAQVGLESPFRVGRYGVNRRDLERVGVPAIERAIRDAELVVMDEIGRMELCSEAFQSAVIRALDSPAPVLGTLQARSNEFLDAVRAREDVAVINVTTANRECLVPVLRDRVLEILGRSKD